LDRSFHHYQTHKLNRNAWIPERAIATVYDKDRKPLMFEFDKVLEKEDGVYVSASNSSKNYRLKPTFHSSDV
jgi:hypothetical protein